MTGIVLGSGLSGLLDLVAQDRTVPFADAGLPSSAVPGHSGEFVSGRIGREPVLVMAGRIHLYENHDARTVTAGIRWMADHGVTRLILTNAAGTLNPEFPPGTWMCLADHLNLTGTSPLSGADGFIDMSRAYDPDWRTRFHQSAAQLGIPLHSGVYAGLRGPQYETPAEIRMLRTLGADAVGMSTVLETIQARALGLPVAAFSCLTNWAAGLGNATLHHDEVAATGRLAAGAMITLLREVLADG